MISNVSELLYQQRLIVCSHMMIVLKSALARQGASCLIGIINCLMAPSANAFYTAQEGFLKDALSVKFRPHYRFL